jgi:hypothetical protein
LTLAGNAGDNPRPSSQDNLPDKHMDNNAELSKEQQIMRAMRKTLTSVVRDVAPRDGVPSPLSPDTVENIRMCLGLISAREAELAGALGLSRSERPHFSDEPVDAQAMQFVPPAKKLN